MRGLREAAGGTGGEYKYNELRDENKTRRCPLCLQIMHKRNLLPPDPNPRALRTRAHVLSYALAPKVWIYACAGCNTDQGPLTMVAWYVELRAAGDARVDRLERALEAVIKRVK